MVSVPGVFFHKNRRNVVQTDELCAADGEQARPVSFTTWSANSANKNPKRVLDKYKAHTRKRLDILELASDELWSPYLIMQVVLLSMAATSTRSTSQTTTATEDVRPEDRSKLLTLNRGLTKKWVEGAHILILIVAPPFGNT